MNTTPATLTRLLTIVLTAALFGGCDSAEPDVGRDLESAPLEDEDSDGIAALEVVQVAHHLGADALTARPNPTHDSDHADPSTTLAIATNCPVVDAPGVTYIAQDPDVCAEISVMCADGWTNIDPACGCGCERTSLTVADQFAIEP